MEGAQLSQHSPVLSSTNPGVPRMLEDRHNNNTRLTGANSGLGLIANDPEVLDRRENTLNQYGWQCRLKTRWVGLRVLA